MDICCKKTTLGVISVAAVDGHIVAISLLRQGDPLPETQTESPLHKEAFRQIEEYLRGERRDFDLPIKLIGTEFRKKVWREMLKVGYGKTATYGQIAQGIGQPKACRAVGGANHHNPLLLVVP